jgi:hypothetical protein
MQQERASALTQSLGVFLRPYHTLLVSIDKYRSLLKVLIWGGAPGWRVEGGEISASEGEGACAGGEIAAVAGFIRGCEVS